MRLRKTPFTLFAAFLLCACSEPSMYSEAEQIADAIIRPVFPEREIVVPAGSLRAEIQAAVDEMSLSGGGTVTLAAGEHFSAGSIFLRSNVNLHLEEGAALLFSGHPDDFLPVVASRWEGIECCMRSPMIYASQCQNVVITGKGTIDAQAGLEFTKWDRAAQLEQEEALRRMADERIPARDRIFGEGSLLRPCFIEFYECSSVLVEGVTLKNSPFWNIHPVYCSDVVVTGVTVDSHFMNNDGCDPDSSRGVLIEHCTFDTGDDSVAIKSGKDIDGRSIAIPSSNVVVRHCTFASRANGLAIGSEMSGGVENVYLYDIDVTNLCKRGVYLKSNKDRGGFIRNVYVDDIRLASVKQDLLKIASDYYGCRGGDFASVYKNLHFSNITADSVGMNVICISGYESDPIRDVSFSDISVRTAGGSCSIENCVGITTTRCEFGTEVE